MIEKNGSIRMFLKRVYFHDLSNYANKVETMRLISTCSGVGWGRGSQL